MFVVFILLAAPTVLAIPCGPYEVYVREQWVEKYTKLDGTEVRSHPRAAHYRTVEHSNYFQDSTNQKFKNIKTNLRAWKINEKIIVEESLKQIPEWLKKYVILEHLRGDTDGTINPAASIALTKTLIVYDRFFQSLNKVQVLTHEAAHLSVLDLEERELMEFAVASGWIINRSKGIKIPPKILVVSDSNESVVEDYANHVELFHFHPEELKRLNPKSFAIIEKIAKKRGHK